MRIRKFVQQVEHLLFTGAIEGEEVLKLHRLLKAYAQGKISAGALQQVIDQHNPDKVEQWLDKNLPPLLE
ncbi:MAG: hypothetical protein Kow00121_64850 [Elainellaceae cyanobacterium]